ncbi:uncharacterized protein LOC18023028 [Eutrema salsugineum]|uniref:uncharacterized protein LOC18023028 n=1 Tax=Eutrema salsugineum TaxID=72664 RepID=UPI000CED45CB|nr:uncharacterized protein LOC18023028 [Eutrema salsugineum]
MEEIEQIHEGFLGAVKLDAHRHLLFPTNTSSKCIVCSKERHENTKGFSCNQCKLYFHKDCIEITIPSHHRHPLKLHDRKKPYSIRNRCFLCGYTFLDMFYYCSRCVFDVCMSCLKMPLIIDRPRAHEHPLSLMPINSISFTCEACGCGAGGSYPCICLRCSFIIHKDCIDLPRVICINRHDHRISHVDILSPEEWSCGVCHMSINSQYGAYSCSVCHFAVHTKCAIRADVWDGRELEGIHDEDGNAKTVDAAPFEVIDDQVIIHFSHEHTLRLFYQDVLIPDKNQRCNACVLPFYYGAGYICMDCDFILHQTCANLPRMKRHELHNNQLTLYPNQKSGEELEFGKSFFRCSACKTLNGGFRYENGSIKLDVRCAMISGEFRHESHPHSLFIVSSYFGTCSICIGFVNDLLSCVECSHFFMCFKCATLPNEVFYKHDKHPLYLRYYRHEYCHYWCEVCEKPTNPYRWFYSCETCASTLHIDCLLGKSPYMKPGHSFLLNSLEYQVVSNNHASRQFCIVCHLRCEDAFVIQNKNEILTSSICSLVCLYSLVGYDRMEMQQCIES